MDTQEKLDRLEINYDYLKEENEKLREENKKLKDEVEQLKNKRIFSSAEYDLITLTSTTPQWELRRINDGDIDY